MRTHERERKRKRAHVTWPDVGEGQPLREIGEMEARQPSARPKDAQ